MHPRSIAQVASIATSRAAGMADTSISVELTNLKDAKQVIISNIAKQCQRITHEKGSLYLTTSPTLKIAAFTLVSANPLMLIGSTTIETTKTS